MRISDLTKNPFTINKSIENIRNNKTQGYLWFATKGKNGCLFELGGKNWKGVVELKVYIPKFENGNYVVYPNEFVNHDYAITFDSLEYPDKNIRLNKTLTEEEFIKLIKSKDFRVYKPKIRSKNYVKEWGVDYIFGGFESN